MDPKSALRPVRACECGQVAHLHRSVFSAEEIARTIYVSRRVARYLEKLIAFPHLQGSHAIWGYWDGERLIGYAHFSALPESWHLQYLAVSPDHQHMGIGRKLWNAGIDVGRQRGCEQVSLRVGYRNQLAAAWYQNLGLRVVGGIWVYEKAIRGNQRAMGSSTRLQEVELLDWEQSEAWQSSYGFSEFRLVHRQRSWTVGRLGKRHFRVDQLLPAVLETALAEIDARRRLLIVSSRRLQGADLQLASRQLVMQGKIDAKTEIIASKR